MFVCRDCGHIFYEDRADIGTEKHAEEIWGSTQVWEEYWLLCPDCGSENIREYWGDLKDGDNIADEVDEVEYEDEEVKK